MLTNSGIQQRIGYGSNFNKISIIGEVLIKQSMNSYGHKKMENEIAFYKFLSEVKRAEPLCGSERFLDSFPRIGSADSETNGVFSCNITMLCKNKNFGEFFKIGVCNIWILGADFTKSSKKNITYMRI